MQKDLLELKRILTQMPRKQVKRFWDGKVSNPEIEKLAREYPLDYLELLKQLGGEYHFDVIDDEDLVFSPENDQDLLLVAKAAVEPK